MTDRTYQMCTRCVMDTSDHQISFDESGVCDHCRSFELHVRPYWHTDERGRRQLDSLMERIRDEGRDKEFDSIIGMSGGADSSYMLHVVVREFGLRPLVFHVDGGWNADVAVSNIQNMVSRLKLDLYTEVIDWGEMRDFQLAFIRSGLPCIDIPQDHAFVATLYNYADRHRIKYILNGFNFSTEGVRNPKEYFYYGTDMALIRDVRRRYCRNPMASYPFSSVFRHKIYLRYIRGIQVVKPLNHVPYIKRDAMALLEREYGWRAYSQKHFESRFTRFYEGFWLPRKFGFDPRRVQFSSLILSDQLSRAEAISRLQQPALSDAEVEQEFDYVATKLGISAEELTVLFEGPRKTHRDYRNQEWLFELGARCLRLAGLERSIKR